MSSENTVFFHLQVLQWAALLGSESARKNGARPICLIFEQEGVYLPIAGGMLHEAGAVRAEIRKALLSVLEHLDAPVRMIDVTNPENPGSVGSTN
jgi:hypothetical protein